MSIETTNSPEFQPDYTAPVAKATVTAREWALRDIADRNNALICVIVSNPKQPGSDAHLMFPFQGEMNEPTVTVAEYLKVAAELHGKMGPLGSARVRSDLLWNLNKKFVKLVDRNGNDL